MESKRIKDRRKSTQKSPLKMIKNILTPRVNEVKAHNLTMNSPWPQPSPMNPLELPASVIHVPKEEIDDFLIKVVARYTRTLKKYTMSTLLETLNGPLVERIKDEDFNQYINRTCFGKLLDKNISEYSHKIFFDQIDDNETYFTYTLHTLKHIETYENMYVENSLSLFKKTNDGVECVAIEIDNQLILPGSDDRWELAKFYVLQGSAIVLTACVHPKIHFPVDSVNGITKSLLPKNHLIHQILSPHMYIQLPLNFAVQYVSKSVAHGDQNEIYTPYPTDKKGFFGQVSLGYKGTPGEYRYQKYKFPLSPDQFETSYGNFLNGYWDVIYSFVSKVVSHIDPKEELVQFWANSISNYVNGFPNGDNIRKDDNLAKAITSYIHNCSVSHAVDHYTYGRIPLRHAPLRVRVPFPDQSEKNFKLDYSKIITSEDYIRHKLCNEMFFKENNLTLLKDALYDFDSEVFDVYVKEFKFDLYNLDKKFQKDDIAFIPLREISASIQY